ncbi:lytic transglycosylase domain-containing protein [Cardiobacterium valvarum]|mgnify:CR=1 FL=1|uniref:Transglycosylase SLT domain protein n=1 Tax=Cardiobacterium valvarum F0432 TaxID=797473 RepID=G9ZJ92_9GAMM|nr:transglycosylase SLT domain-containing protein [Cardiobacterium valvarum]EHM50233.1 transglycosylase SLT domain protein [Cardiobacterium valvarum F0432]
MMKRTVLLSLLMLALTGCFDHGDKASGKVDYDAKDEAYQAQMAAGEDAAAYEGESGEVPLLDSTPIPMHTGEFNPPPHPRRPQDAGSNTQRQRFVGEILRASSRYGVEVELIHAIISRESLYQPGVVSDAGAVGLMQLLPSTGRRFGCTNLYNAACNVNAGTAYLKYLAELFNGNIQTIAAGYNAGEGVAYSYLHGIPERNVVIRGKKIPMKGKNPSGIKTPNGVPLASFSYSRKQKARGCPSNNWNPTPQCQGETYTYVRHVTGFYLLYKQHPELVGKATPAAPSVEATKRGRI